MDLNDRVAVVSAAGAGIGAATASLLARSGCTVIGVDLDGAPSRSSARRSVTTAPSTPSSPT